MNQTELAQRLFPAIEKQPEDVLGGYPARQLKEGAKVTRFAPSPTGFLTIGGIYATLITERLAHQSGGVFYLRIEDTDRKREVEGSIGDILHSLSYCSIYPDEGPTADGEEAGEYGPYKQTERASLYHVFIKNLIAQGLAYPCFCDADELQQIRDKQQAAKLNTGYYGEWAIHRNLTSEQIEAELATGKPYVIRLKSPGSPERRIKYMDLIKGEIELPENEQDIVIMKSDGIPTYHFAHAVDDCLMGTTHVIRGDEWLASVPIHLQLFDMLGFRRPEYGHLAPLMKMDGASKRKFSKRKDRDAAASYYEQEGYPGISITEYLMTLINSNYEEWRVSQPEAPYSEFMIDVNKMNVSGALFDMDKLIDISKGIIARLSADEVFEHTAEWAAAHDTELEAALLANREYSTAIFRIGRAVEKPRKDIAKWSDVKDLYAYFFDESFSKSVEAGYDSLPASISLELAKQIVREYAQTLDLQDDRDSWFSKVKAIGVQLGFAKDAKTHKKNPEQYPGHVGDVAMILRVALTGRTMTLDLYDMMHVMGDARVRARLNRFIG
ncbi:glutamate--tRNA ligase [Paenibacillus lignilyticus]|uniref:Glutamate--tRNA ligase n=1 Tax=Paenibacillus lignilyticus TaxID=1172615 RepID=A0ABS5CGR7_9BACL|nr:glutamate--tRNA ligase [Paenibacillus lignilyticus]MBP3965021.1 glutamate--tRNA ligase [Paenibacillus lignilyticus]